jgi:hypothetical protein
MRRASAGLGLSVLGLFAPLIVGCPANTCFLKICEGANCRCSISSCGEGAAFDTQQNRCRCVVGYFPVAGQCLTQRDANQYCGLGHHWANGGCALDVCRPGDELDLSTGMCIPHDRVNQVGAGIGVQVAEGQKLGCPAGQRLIIDGATAACVPIAQTCAPDEAWTGKDCAKVAACPTGSIWDPSRTQCIKYAQGSSGDGLAVNVTDWAQANYGPNGGAGAPGFCASFAKKPWSFGIVEGSSANVRVTVMLSFPESQVARGVAQTTTVFDASSNPVPSKGASEVDAAAKGIFAPLVAGGGKASQGTIATTVKCLVTNASKPQAIPATGGI